MQTFQEILRRMAAQLIVSYDIKLHPVYDATDKAVAILDSNDKPDIKDTKLRKIFKGPKLLNNAKALAEAYKKFPDIKDAVNNFSYAMAVISQPDISPTSNKYLTKYLTDAKDDMLKAEKEITTWQMKHQS